MRSRECPVPEFNPTPREIIDCLAQSRTVAVVGLSPKETRDSHMVAAYLLDQGYEVIPVNPGQKRILGRECYRSLSDIPFHVDLADLFVPHDRVWKIVDQAIEKRIPYIWMQIGVVDNGAAERARAEGTTVIMNRCIKVEHRKNSDRLTNAV